MATITATFSDATYHIDLSTLADVIVRPIDGFLPIGKVSYDEAKAPLVFVDNGANILAVAHLDTVQKPAFNGYYCKQQSKTRYISASGLDDRLGVYTLLYMLPQMGVKADLLLTTNEESCASTAKAFYDNVYRGLGRKYHWMAEFDRRSDDVVFYRYDTPDWRKAAVAAGFVVGVGSYTDICDLYQLGVAGINVGVGYELAHDANSYFNVADYFAQLYRFGRFYAANSNTTFAVDPAKVQPYRRYSYGNDYDYTWTQNKTTPASKAPYMPPLYTFTCPYCGQIRGLEPEQSFTCHCGRYWYRGAIAPGKIYEQLLDGRLVLQCTPAQSLPAPLPRQLTFYCDLCEAAVSGTIRTAEGYNLCKSCIDLLTARCISCHRLFITDGNAQPARCPTCDYYHLLR